MFVVSKLCFFCTREKRTDEGADDAVQKDLLKITKHKNKKTKN
jgi:hypothetical protein